MSLKARLLRRAIIGLLSLPALLFISAGSLKFWQAWAFLALITAKAGKAKYEPSAKGIKRNITLANRRFSSRLCKYP